MSKRRRRTSRRQQPVSWLPIDSRLILPLFSFGHVKGIARVFLILEMVLSLGVVVGTLALVFFTFAS